MIELINGLYIHIYKNVCDEVMYSLIEKQKDNSQYKICNCRNIKWAQNEYKRIRKSKRIN